jgi:hypothetical protein
VRLPGLIPAAVVVPATIITAVIITLVIVSVSIVAVSVIPVSGPAYYYDGNGFRIRGNQSEQSRSEQENKEKFFHKSDFLRLSKPGTG